MNKNYFSYLLCLTILACIPACSKKKTEVIYHEDIKTMIELDNAVIETEEITIDEQIIKF